MIPKAQSTDLIVNAFSRLQLRSATLGCFFPDLISSVVSSLFFSTFKLTGFKNHVGCSFTSGKAEKIDLSILFSSRKYLSSNTCNCVLLCFLARHCSEQCISRRCVRACIYVRAFTCVRACVRARACRACVLLVSISL